MKFMSSNEVYIRLSYKVSDHTTGSPERAARLVNYTFETWSNEHDAHLAMLKPGMDLLVESMDWNVTQVLVGSHVRKL